MVKMFVFVLFLCFNIINIEIQIGVLNERLKIYS